MLLPQIIGGLLQEKPKVPEFTPVDTKQEQANAINANLQNLSSAQELASKTNAFNYDQMTGMLKKFIPNYDQLLSQTGSNIESMLKGEIPKDVQDQIMRNVAQRGIAGGFSGSGFGRNLEAKDLGLTSLQLTQQGFDAANRWLSTARSTMPNLFDASSMFITPAQQLAVATDNRNGAFQRQFTQNQLNAQYAPGTIVGQAIIKTDDQITQMASSIAGSAAGAAI